MKKYLAIIAILILAAGIATFVYYNRRIAPLLTVQQAVSNLSDEVILRINVSPLLATGLLSDALEDGSVFFSSRLNQQPSVIANLSLATNAESRERALEMDVSFMRLLNINLEAYMDTQRMAVRVLPLVDNFYGFTYDTFREDIQIFGNTAGLGYATMDRLADMVEALDKNLNAPPREENLLQPYINILVQFLRESNFAASRGADGLNHIEFSFDRREVISLLDNLHTALQNDDDIRIIYEVVALLNPSNPSFDQMLEQIYVLIRELETTVYDLSLGFAIENRRIRQVTVTSRHYGRNSLPYNAEQPGQRNIADVPYVYTVMLNFGQSVSCSWSLYVEMNTLLRNTVTWDFTYGDYYMQSLSFASATAQSSYLATKWMPATGDLSISVNDATFPGVLNLREDGSFRLRVDTSIPFEISVRQETPDIGEIEFINLDMWDAGLLGAVMELYNLVAGFMPAR